jgi:hypothetical protein
MRRGNVSWKAKEREKVQRGWNCTQAALLGAVLFSAFLPLAWGWTSNGEIGWAGYAKFVALSLLGLAAAGEFVRRISNWEFDEPVCKWIWQK